MICLLIFLLAAVFGDTHNPSNASLPIWLQHVKYIMRRHQNGRRKRQRRWALAVRTRRGSSSAWSSESASASRGYRSLGEMACLKNITIDTECYVTVDIRYHQYLGKLFVVISDLAVERIVTFWWNLVPNVPKNRLYPVFQRKMKHKNPKIRIYPVFRRKKGYSKPKIRFFGFIKNTDPTPKYNWPANKEEKGKH